MPALPRATFSKPMSPGDSALMMWLSLNLLLLVFFVLLTSMAAYGQKHANEVLAKAKDTLPAVASDGGGDAIIEAPRAAWRAGVVSRVQGVVVNRIDLRVAPQAGNADKVEIDMPASALFDAEGRLVKPEVIRNIAAAAGTESTLVWQTRGPWASRERLAVMAAALGAEAGHAEIARAASEGVRVVIIPGHATRPETGLQVQEIGEGARGDVKGMDERRSDDE